MKTSLFIFSLLLFSLRTTAQSRNPISIEVERPNNQAFFYAKNDTYAPYTITLKFKELINTHSVIKGEEIPIVISPGKRQILILIPSNQNKSIGYSYSWTSRKGDYKAQADTNFVYLFPLAKNQTVRVNQIVSYAKAGGQKGKAYLSGFVFYTHEGDTVVASRGGIVTEITNNVATDDPDMHSAKGNHVEICHKDGTFARYIFKNKGLFVNTGDPVIPGQPLGIYNGKTTGKGSHLGLILYAYWPEHHILIPNFYLSPSEIGKPQPKALYVSEHPKEYITLEMSKKEKKKYLGEH